MFKKKKILCYVLVFDQVDIIKKCLTFLSKYSDRLDLIVLENPSKNTPVIKNIVENMGKQGHVKRYYLFDENITGIAMMTVLNKEQALVKKSAYTIISDGDLVSSDADWLDEEVGILKHNPDVLACGISLDMSNLPLKTYPESTGWIPPDISEKPDYYEAVTGGHLLMLRGRDFSDYIDWKNSSGADHIDSIMHKYCYETKHKKWARTKKSKAYHLTWDLYADKNHPYTKFRSKKTFKETWHHTQTATYTVTDFSD
ncbi:MAG TPA: hypothetical protein VLE73_04905 [Candidatus Saccharimonadales bacterium]|nr:hypothetical protein [Candidatus Saccharimonadales bacterium]